MKYYLEALNKYANFTGRAGRKEYWMFILFNIIFCFFSALFDNVFGLTFNTDGNVMGYGYIYTAYCFFVLVPGMSVMVRRLHDIGKSGWFFMIVLIPLAGAIWLLVLLCKEGNPAGNRYGSKTKEIA